MTGTTYDLLAEHPFLDGFTDWQLERLSRHAHRSLFHAGNRVFQEGWPADRFWLIVQGRVELDMLVPERGDVTVEALHDGAVLGWSWMLPPYRWHLGAVAVTTTSTIEFDAAAVRRLCQEDPALGYELTSRLMRVVAQRLQRTRRRLLDLRPATS